jgi:NDP-sugar pyrophosphorylase family protein
MNILIPMAGEGSRFVAEGYAFPKPLIDVNGQPMIQRVVENLRMKEVNRFIFLVRDEHIKKYPGIIETLQTITSNKCDIVNVKKLTEGAACTALLAERYINNDEDLLIANSDQLIEYSPQNFDTIKKFTNSNGVIFTFSACHPKWSFARLKEGKIVEVAEKKPISDVATCGIYWFKKGSDFVFSARRMIEKNIRVNNEFYIAPVFNELIENNQNILPFYVEKMWGLGTPEDLKFYLAKCN